MHERFLSVGGKMRLIIFVENDCEFGYDEDYEIFTAVLLNDKGETLEIEADESEMQDMVVAVEFVKVEECEEEDA